MLQHRTVQTGRGPYNIGRAGAGSARDMYRYACSTFFSSIPSVGGLWFVSPVTADLRTVAMCVCVCVLNSDGGKQKEKPSTAGRDEVNMNESPGALRFVFMKVRDNPGNEDKSRSNRVACGCKVFVSSSPRPSIFSGL